MGGGEEQNLEADLFDLFPCLGVTSSSTHFGDLTQGHYLRGVAGGSSWDINPEETVIRMKLQQTQSPKAHLTEEE